MATETYGAETASEYAKDASSSAFPPFDATTFSSQIFWLVISFAILYLVLSRFILPKLGGIIEERKGKIASDLDEAARMKAEADVALAETEQQLNAARVDARTKADKARADIDAKIAKISAEKAVELDLKLTEAEVRIDVMQRRAMDKVSDIATETTRGIAAKLNVAVSDSDIDAAVTQQLGSA